MQERHFIFDIDGTLINTEKAIIKGLQELLLEEKGSQYAPEQLYFCLGIPGSQALAQLGIEDGIPEKLKNGMPSIIRMPMMFPFILIFRRFWSI